MAKVTGSRMKADDIACIEEVVKALEVQPVEIELSEVLTGKVA